tara:strand:- start:3439 stop:3867 length:429 start_codon:yes stop_codon:yes gene_type:complete
MIYHSEYIDEIKTTAVNILSDLFKVDKKEVLNMKSRQRRIVCAKRFLIFFLYRYVKVTHTNMRLYINDLHHSTSIHHVNKLESLLEFDKETKNLFDEFIFKMNNSIDLKNNKKNDIIYLNNELNDLKIKCNQLQHRLKKILE